MRLAANPSFWRRKTLRLDDIFADITLAPAVLEFVLIKAKDSAWNVLIYTYECDSSQKQQDTSLLEISSCLISSMISLQNGVN